MSASFSHSLHAQVCTSNGWNTLQYINNTDLQFVKLGATGHTILVSSGDQGAPGDENVDCSKDAQLALYPQVRTTASLSPQLLASPHFLYVTHAHSHTLSVICDSLHSHFLRSLFVTQACTPWHSLIFVF